MSDGQFRANNHYVSRGYLKRWAQPADGRLWAYELLVPHPNVPLWKSVTPGHTARREHLYTRIVDGEETDEFERWFAEEVEGPAELPLEKATSGARLTADDWTCLMTFVAAQDLRTPASYQESMERWQSTIPEIMDESLHSSVRSLSDPLHRPQRISTPPRHGGADVPIRVRIKQGKGQEPGEIRSKVLLGRQYWLSEIRRKVQENSKALYQLKWTILCPPEGMAWLTSDAPVVRVNYYSPANYNFRGGWASKGTDVIFPVSPGHLLHTRIGSGRQKRVETAPEELAKLIRRLVVEHAHRVVFACDRDQEVPKLRRRVADADLIRCEQAEWGRWHKQQSAAERNFWQGDTET